MLRSVAGMWLTDINLRGEEISRLTLPTFDGQVDLSGVSGDISQLLPLISCDKLWIGLTKLSRSDTEALVQCLYTNVSELVLAGDVTVDIDIMCQYKGSGKCKYVQCYDDSYKRYRSQVTRWGHNMGWKVRDSGSSWLGGITITRD